MEFPVDAGIDILPALFCFLRHISIFPIVFLPFIICYPIPHLSLITLWRMWEFPVLLSLVLKAALDSYFLFNKPYSVSSSILTHEEIDENLVSHLFSLFHVHSLIQVFSWLHLRLPGIWL